jgi:hypothetical protein
MLLAGCGPGDRNLISGRHFWYIPVPQEGPRDHTAVCVHATPITIVVIDEEYNLRSSLFWDVTQRRLVVSY